MKTNNGVIGINAGATRANCDDNNDVNKYTQSIAKWFQNENRSAGVVTNTRITHATPAGVYANTANRDWEGNADVTKSACDHGLIDDIAEQLVRGDVGSKLKVVLGGGSKYFVNATETIHGISGVRTDGKNLINEWKNAKSNRNFVANRDEMMAADNNKELFGLFHSDHLPYFLETVEKNEQSVYPTLSEMTAKAIDVLSQDDNGYFLLVEGGRIDHAHHDTLSRLALGETVELSKAVQTALDKVDLDETLIVVTADHSHTMSIAGYAVSKLMDFLLNYCNNYFIKARGNDIFGIGGTADDGLPYLTLSYANGPGKSLDFMFKIFKLN